MTIYAKPSAYELQVLRRHIFLWLVVSIIYSPFITHAHRSSRYAKAVLVREKTDPIYTTRRSASRSQCGTFFLWGINSGEISKQKLAFPQPRKSIPRFKSSIISSIPHFANRKHPPHRKHSFETHTLPFLDNLLKTEQRFIQSRRKGAARPELRSKLQYTSMRTKH